MKPAWEKLGETFNGVSNVVIGDADCTVERDLCSTYGVKGYPTIKYWAPDSPQDGTKYAGGRDFDSLTKFVQDTLEVQCTIEDQSRCDEREIKYIAKMQAKPEKVAPGLARLEKMKSQKMKSELKAWVMKRYNILSQLNKGGKDEL